MPDTKEPAKFSGQIGLLKSLGLSEDLIDDFFDPESKFNEERARKELADYYREALSEDDELASKIWNKKKYQKDEEFLRLLKKNWPITDPELKKKADKGIKEYVEVIVELQKTGDQTLDELKEKLTKAEAKIQDFEEEVLPQKDREKIDARNEVHVRYAFREQLRKFNISEEKGIKIMRNMERDFAETDVKMIPDDTEVNGIKLVGKDGNPYRPSTEAKPWQFQDKLTQELQFMGILNSDGELVSGSRTPPNEPDNAAGKKTTHHHGTNEGDRRKTGAKANDKGLSASQERIAELERLAKAKKELNPMGN